MASIRLYAVLLNKSSDEEFPALVSKVEGIFDRYFSNDDHLMDTSTRSEGKQKDDASSPVNDNALSKRLIILFTTVVKALAMRGIPDLTKWVDKIVTLLDHPEFGLMLSNELPTIMTECNFSLNSKSFCRFRFLYRQRLFLESVPKLVGAYQRSSKDSGVIRANYMRALSSQLKHVPGPVLQTQINTVFPLLMASLTVDSNTNEGSNVEMLMSTLTALFDFFKSKSEESSLGAEGQEQETLIEYFHDMVPRLLTLVKFKPSMDVRMLALKCLRCCARLPTHVVLPMKPTVTIDLKSALDDPKRLVRREAQATINIWILVGAPGGV
jgi:DNA repair/transcription protein MET18/MMS19